MAEKILWDSCVIIDAIQKKDGTFIFLDEMLRRAEAGKLLIVISAVSVAEVTYLKEFAAKGMSRDRQASLIQDWLNQDYIFKRNADPGICSDAAKLARQLSTKGKSLTPLDSIILATALRAEVEVLITDDDGKTNNKHLGLLELNEQLGDPKLKILRPSQYKAQLPMDLKIPEAPADSESDEE